MASSGQCPNQDDRPAGVGQQWASPTIDSGGMGGGDGDDDARRRRPWFETACCPTNMARFVATLPSLIATVSDTGVSIHQYIAARISPGAGGWTPPGGSAQAPELEIRSDYPASGTIEVTVDGFAGLVLRLRIPEWSRTARLEVNGSPVELRLVDGYAELRRRWQPRDVVRLDLAVEPESVGSAPSTDAAAPPALRQRLRRDLPRRGPEDSQDPCSCPSSQRLRQRLDRQSATRAPRPHHHLEPMPARAGF